ncbi:MAG: AAA family ATPase [Alphaproteobacteria bacterium]|nr:AAA family ATPase [Alphaproteobacteria bacterium]
MIIGVLQQKGGVGKTTLALNLAAAYAKEGLKVLLVDADPQASSLTWSSVREAKPIFAVVGMPKPSLHKDLPVVAKDYDLVVIDGAPQTRELARSAILASDYVLIPVQPSPFDVWSCSEIVSLITEAQQFKSNIKAGFVINRKIGNTVIGRDVKQAFEQFPFPLLKSHISQRVAFAEAAAQGLTVIETAPDSPAAWEIYGLTDLLKTATNERTAA